MHLLNTVALALGRFVTGRYFSRPRAADQPPAPAGARCVACSCPAYLLSPCCGRALCPDCQAMIKNEPHRCPCRQ